MSNNRILLATVVCGALLLGSGCWNTVFVASSAGHVTTKAKSGGQPFNITVHQGFGFWGLSPSIKIVEVDRVVSAALRQEVTNISDLRIRQGLNFGTWLLGGITLGLYAPKTLTIEGSIHGGRTTAVPVRSNRGDKKQRPAPVSSASPFGRRAPPGG